MVYFLTSHNVKLLRNIFEDYAASPELTPYEYIKIYMEKCPEVIEESKLLWITESFLGVLKHRKLLQDIAVHMCDEINEEEKQYFTIIFHALIFEIKPKDVQKLYKCMFNLNKNLLDLLFNLLSNNEILPYISQVAQKYYDSSYITNKIIGPLFEWQPYISEIAHEYAVYEHNIELRKVKPPTIPIQPKVLMHFTESKQQANKQSFSTPLSIPSTPPNSENVVRSKNMLTKASIDKKIEKFHEKNKEKANKLLNCVKNKEFSYAKSKSEKYYKRISEMQNEMDVSLNAPKYKASQLRKVRPMTFKDNIATIKRINNRIKETEDREIQWLQNLLTNCGNSAKIDELEQCERKEKERERLIAIERKHLIGQISHEEAVIAKKKLIDINKKKYQDFLNEKSLWLKQIDDWKKSQVENNRRQVERLSLAELSLQESKTECANKKKEQVLKIKKDYEALKEQAIRVKQKELENKINMIKELKVLAMIAKESKMPKVIDLTETAGFGFLCEMSVAELQERLSKMKMELVDELENKKKLIRERKETAKQELQDIKNYVKDFLNERTAMRKNNKKILFPVESGSSKEINDLKKILEEKRKLRRKLCAT